MGARAKASVQMSRPASNARHDRGSRQAVAITASSAPSHQTASRRKVPPSDSQGAMRASVPAARPKKVV